AAKAGAVSHPSAKVIARAREQLSGTLKLPATSTPRDYLKALVEDLNPVIKSSNDLEARLLRARANRWMGEHLEAVTDLTEVLRRSPRNLSAVTERLLASYQLHVLYLGNLNDPVLRPLRQDRVRDDVQLLKERGDAVQKLLARLVEALAAQAYGEA